MIGLGRVSSRDACQGSVELKPNVLVGEAAGQMDADPAATHGDTGRDFEDVESESVDLEVGEAAGRRHLGLEYIQEQHGRLMQKEPELVRPPSMSIFHSLIRFSWSPRWQ